VGFVLAGYILLIAKSLILWIFDGSTVPKYMTSVLLHVVLGTVLVIPVAVFLFTHLMKMSFHLNRGATVVGAATSISLTLSTRFGILIFWAPAGGGWLLTSTSPGQT